MLAACASVSIEGNFSNIMFILNQKVKRSVIIFFPYLMHKYHFFLTNQISSKFCIYIVIKSIFYKLKCKPKNNSNLVISIEITVLE